PHCWNATSRAEPEYVMDCTLPKARRAFSMTVAASCAAAIPHRDVAQSAASANLFTMCRSPFPRCYRFFRKLQGRGMILYAAQPRCLDRGGDSGSFKPPAAGRNIGGQAALTARRTT